MDDSVTQGTPTQNTPSPTTSSKKQITPVIILGGIALILIIVLVLFLLNPFTSNPGTDTNTTNNGSNTGTGNNTNQNNTIDVNTYCIAKKDLNIPGVFAVANDSNSIFSLISPLGANAKYFIVQGKSTGREVITNIYAGKSGNDANIAALLKEKGVTALVVADLKNELILEIGKQKIACYKVSGNMGQLLGETPPTPPKPVDTTPTTCKKMNLSDINSSSVTNPIALATDGDTKTGLISPLNAKAKYFYINKKSATQFEQTINTFASKSNADANVVSLLKGLGVKTVVVANPTTAFAAELEKASIACISSNGRISTIVK